MPIFGHPDSDPSPGLYLDRCGSFLTASYAGYIERQHQKVARLRGNEDTALPDDLDYRGVRGLSAEIQQKLNEHKPATIGQV